MPTPFEIKEFHGGITDNYVDCAPFQYRYADNFTISANRKLITRPGSKIYDALNPQLPSGNQRMTGMHEHDNLGLFFSGRDIFSYNGLAFSSFLNAFDQGTTEDYPVGFYWNKHSFFGNTAYSNIIKLFKDSGDVLRLRKAGLPKLSGVIASSTPGDKSYKYALYFHCEYMVGTVTHIDASATQELQVTSVSEPNTSNIILNNIPSISDTGYDVANIKVKIFRTESGGTVLHYIGEVANGISTFTDDKADATIANNEVIYTSGGVLDNDPPPRCKAFHACNGVAFYGNVIEGTQYLTNRVRQSVPSDLDSCPESLYKDLEDSIVTISSYADRVIALCDNYIYRLDGVFDELGNGGITEQRISDIVGCISAKSVVQLPNGIAWAGKDGFYFTDGFQLRKLSGEFNVRYGTLTETSQQKQRIYGSYDRLSGLVCWSVQSSPAIRRDVDELYVWHYSLEPSEFPCFTVWKNGENFAPTCHYFKNGSLIRGDKRGFIFNHSSSLWSDPLVDTTLPVSQWDTSAIIFYYVSLASSLGSTMYRKYTTKVLLDAKNRSNVSIQIISNDDLDAKRSFLKPIRHRGNVIWGDYYTVWGDPDLKWNSSGLVEGQRRFPSKALRQSFKQIEITNAYVNILASDAVCAANVDSANNTVSLTDITQNWPTNIKGYMIAFESDNYTQEFPISQRFDDTLVIEDLGETVPSGVQKWIMRGYPKEEVLDLLSILIHFDYLGQTQNTYSPSQDGGNN